MTQDLNLKALERRAWRSFYQDGLWDIALGMILLAFSAGAFLDRTGLSSGKRMTVFMLIEAIGIGFMWFGKRYITMPRIGRVKFSKERTQKRTIIILVLGFSVLLGVVLYVVAVRAVSGSGTGILASGMMPLLWFVNCAIVFSALAYLLDFTRLYFIGAVFAITVPVDDLLRRTTEVDVSYLVFGIPGLIVLGVGIGILIHFLKTYSVPEVDNEG